MKRRFGGGTTQQVATLVVISLLVAHALSGVVWWFFDARPGPPPEYINPVSRIGLVLHLLDSVPKEFHPAILAAAERGGLVVRQGDGTPPQLSIDRDPGVTGLCHALDIELGGEHSVTAGREVTADGHPGPLDVLVRSGDRWLEFRLGPDRGGPRHWISPGGLGLLVTILLLVGFISLWAARRITSPLVRLAAATEGLSDLKDPAPVAEEGALEVRQVARAFNSVVQRLHRFVADRTRMLAAVSHDLRTPLTRLKLRAETVPDDETRGKMLNDIRTMESMITTTLAFLRQEGAREKLARVDMAVLLQTICDEFSDTGGDVGYEGPLHCAASCRPQALQRALVNLIDNAVRFEASVVARLEVLPSGFAVTIDDDGPGIPDALKEAVFEPFFSGDPTRNDPHGCTGLGLSIVKAIVQSHGGDIGLSDRVPHGLSVRLYIPFAQLAAGD